MKQSFSFPIADGKAMLMLPRISVQLCLAISADILGHLQISKLKFLKKSFFLIFGFLKTNHWDHWIGQSRFVAKPFIWAQ